MLPTLIILMMRIKILATLFLSEYVPPYNEVSYALDCAPVDRCQDQPQAQCDDTGGEDPPFPPVPVPVYTPSNTTNITDASPTIVVGFCNSTECGYDIVGATDCDTTASLKSRGAQASDISHVAHRRQPPPEERRCWQGFYDSGMTSNFLRVNLLDPLTRGILAIVFTTRYRRLVRYWRVRVRISRPWQNVVIQGITAPPNEDPNSLLHGGMQLNTGENPWQVDYLISPEVLLRFATTTRCFHPLPPGQRSRMGRPRDDAVTLATRLRRQRVRRACSAL